MNELIINDFKKHMSGFISDDKLNAIIKKMENKRIASYKAEGDVESAIFYLHFHVLVSDGKNFNGNAGGISSPGAGSFFGNLFCDDLNKLYENTASFEFQSTSIYLSILFFDKNAELLGHFQGGSISTVAGIGGGSGYWK